MHGIYIYIYMFMLLVSFTSEMVETDHLVPNFRSYFFRASHDELISHIDRSYNHMLVE